MRSFLSIFSSCFTRPRPCVYLLEEYEDKLILFMFAVVSCCEGVWEGEEGGEGGRVVSGGGDGLVKLWDIQDGREVLSMGGHTAEVVCPSVCIQHS